MKSNSRSIDMIMLLAMGPRKEAARGREEINHDTLWYSKWKLEFKGSGSQWAIGKLLA